jgi:hypothetical protein
MLSRLSRSGPLLQKRLGQLGALGCPRRRRNWILAALRLVQVSASPVLFHLNHHILISSKLPNSTSSSQSRSPALLRYWMGRSSWERHQRSAILRQRTKRTKQLRRPCTAVFSSKQRQQRILWQRGRRKPELLQRSTAEWCRTPASSAGVWWTICTASRPAATQGRRYRAIGGDARR